MKAFLQFTLISIKNNFITFFLLYLCLPILLVGYNGFLQRKNFTAETKEAILSIYLNDEDKSPLSEQVSGVLASGFLKDFIKFADKEKADYTIEIPKGYQKAVDSNTPFDILIIGKEKSSSTTLFLSNIIQNISNSINGNYKIKMAISNSDIKEDLMTKYTNLQSELSKPIGKISEQKAADAISSYEAFAITMIIILFFMFIIEPIQIAYKKKNIGLGLRINSVPHSRVYIFNANIVSHSLKTFIATTVYISIFRVLNISFTGNPVLVLLYLIFFSLIAGVIGSTLVCFNNKEIAYAITILLFLIFCVIGTMLITPIPNKSKFAEKISSYNLSNIIINPLKDIVYTNSFNGMINSFLIMLGFGLVFYILGLTMVMFKKSKI